MAETYRHSAVKRDYAKPGQSASVDGVSVRFWGTDEVRQRLLDMGADFPNRVERILETIAREISVDANAAAHRSRRTFKGRRGGFLARSFAPYPRPQWLKFGVVGMVVRSRAKYHWYQEFGVNAPNRQVVLHRYSDGRTVKRGQGEGRRYRMGTNRLNPGVIATSYRRDIIIPAHPVLGPVFARWKSRAFSDIETGIRNYVRRFAGGP